MVHSMLRTVFIAMQGDGLPVIHAMERLQLPVGFATGIKKQTAATAEDVVITVAVRAAEPDKQAGKYQRQNRFG